ncbi:archaellar assembly protein FlaJ [Halarchaeum nitratireducens]|uniref:Flagellar assembly protein J n=1 Tax=Halarchaeum nitratireducens TaxID=489913 RepID=A0A830GCU0_9EURY|nr:archaellar assembly protein FlaJ [Halarchaeum nitratireducens]GGN20699.1 flagellar assembly protein J [Halarchaeum nitratireducens]
MAGDGDADGFEVDVRAFVRSFVRAYRYMDISARRYALLVLLPSAALTLGVAAAVVALAPPLSIALPGVLLGVLPALGALAYPKIAADRKRREVREQFHLFLTHITVLSMTNIDRVEIFRTLAQVEEYGALAEEMGRITALVDTWNQSLDDACRRRAKRVPSDLLADFLERLAYTVGAGQALDDFLLDEQESIIREFVIRYESALAKLDVLKELYLSMMLSTTFILVFATVVPILLDVPPTLLITAVIVMFALVQLAFVVVVHTVAPRDPVWLTPETHHSPAHRVRPALYAGVGLSLLAVVGVLVVGLDYTPLDPGRIPYPISLAIPTTPLLLPGLAMRREERAVGERDAGFPSFIRALGGVESVKQTSSANVLESLRRKDFGALTANVDDLYKRLRTRIDTEEAWVFFAAETGSYLIHKFGSMYVVGRRMGGEPRRLGQVISANFNEVLRVREQRQQATTTLIGVIYGITAASMFSSFLGLGIAEQMLDITSRIAGQNDAFIQSLFSTGSYDIATMTVLLLLVVLLNALLSALMIRITDRGHFVSALTHFTLLTWTGALVAVATQRVVSGLIG